MVYAKKCFIYKYRRASGTGICGKKDLHRNCMRKIVLQIDRYVFFFLKKKKCYSNIKYRELNCMFRPLHLVESKAVRKFQLITFACLQIINHHLTHLIHQRRRMYRTAPGGRITWDHLIKQKRCYFL